MRVHTHTHTRLYMRKYLNIFTNPASHILYHTCTHASLKCDFLNVATVTISHTHTHTTYCCEVCSVSRSWCLHFAHLKSYFEVGHIRPTLKRSLQKAGVPSLTWVVLTSQKNLFVFLSFLPDSWTEGSPPDFPFRLRPHCFTANPFFSRFKDCVTCTCFFSPGRRRKSHWIQWIAVTLFILLLWQRRLDKTFTYTF